jgi:benzoate/toluate 1,2-dioxygenase alpha subunit
MDHLIRVWHPLSIDRTEILSYPLRNASLDPELDDARLLDVQMNYSPAGAVAPDDAAIFAAIQTGLRSSKSARFHLSRGIDKEVVSSSGERVGVYSDEAPRR